MEGRYSPLVCGSAIIRSLLVHHPMFDEERWGDSHEALRMILLFWGATWLHTFWSQAEEGLSGRISAHDCGLRDIG